MRIALTLLAATCGLAAFEPRPSTIPALPTSEGMVVLGSERFPLPAAGEDATAAIQAGIDAGSVVVLPSGTWRLTGALDLWKGVRLVGVGPTKPVLELAPQTPGYAGDRPAYLIHFRARKPKPGEAPEDADNDTFGSGLLNLALRIGPGNPAAWAVRYRVAQLCVLEDLDIDLAPEAGGIDQIANLVRGCRITGGHRAIRSDSPMAWHCLIADCEFVGQSAAAIETRGCAPMILRCRFVDQRRALARHRDKPELFLAEACTFVRCATVLAGSSDDAFDALNLLDCSGEATPVLVAHDGGEDLAAPHPDWSLAQVTVGLVIEAGEGTTTAARRSRIIGRPADPAPAPARADLRGAIAVTDHGAIGDGRSDCSAAFRAALATGAPVFVPPGTWRLDDTLALGDGARLVGLHPRATRLVLGDEAVGFDDPTAPRPLLAVDGRDVRMRGIGLGICTRPGAVLIRWRGGAQSSLADCWSQWGKKGQPGPLATLLVEGAGTFSNLWLVNPGASHPLVIRDSAGPGRVELASLEHHRAEELVIERSRGWVLHGIQTERGDQEAPAIRISDSRDLVFGNLYAYRTSASRAQRDAAIRAIGVRDLRIHGLRVYAGSWGGGVDYDHALRLVDRDLAVAPRIAATITVP